ncbi:MAG: hypothetical protein B7Z08_03965 [Sphingomonadales bacterium 32-68-7]|nr:MAG: hypothetical protein B7Z33_13850 [Sphingomonadales bacterium 12-68-11]OYX09692.1 MAG: hypothetical protein B7Z08_03965 [Sphingomonadales bacterium 32-68-7]
MPDIGIHSWPIGSFMPMGLYRPVPIVHFTAAIVVQSLLNLAVVGLLAPGAFAVGACAVIALALARRAWIRWLSRARRGWKIATIAALALNLLPIALASLAQGDERFPSAASSVTERQRDLPFTYF